MRILFTILVFFVTVSNSTAIAQQKSNSSASLLWQISGNGLSYPSYLFGTIHMICEQDYVWSKSMGDALKKSDKVCLEMDMDDPAMMMQVAAAMIDNSGKKLKDYFTTDEYKMLKRFLKDSMAMDIAMFEQVKPFALETIMSTQSAPCKEQVSYEDKIMKLAKEGDKEVMGLEALEEQLAVFESVPGDSMAREIMDMITNKRSHDSEYKQLILSYKQQNIDTLYTLIAKSETFGTNLNTFLDDRNKKWIPRMKEMMAGKTIFFAVGAGHLGGRYGVINLLRNEGYAVTPIIEKGKGR